MSTLKIAVEATERDGRLRDDDPEAVVHAYEVEKGEFAFHNVTNSYTVRPDIAWASILPRGERCPTCRERSQRS